MCVGGCVVCVVPQAGMQQRPTRHTHKAKELYVPMYVCSSS